MRLSPQQLPLVYSQDEYSIIELHRPIQTPNEPFMLFAQIQTEQQWTLIAPRRFIDSISLNTIEQNDHWRVLKVDATLPFEAVGVLADISNVLRNTEVSVFVVSSFATDYILVQSAQFSQAIDALRLSGYSVNQQ